MRDIKAKILSNENVRVNYYKMVLDVPYIAKNAKPGQFVQVRCSDGMDPLLRRPFSVHKVRDGEIEILYEIAGRGTAILAKKKTGEIVDILGPLGNGFTLPPLTINHSPFTILVAGGIGVAPLVFLAEELAKKKIKIVVLIGARTKELILCEKDFKATGAEVHIASDDGSKGFKGFVSKLLEKILRTTNDERRTTIYACGPQPMLKNAASICKKKKMNCQVLLEEHMSCGVGACLGCAVKVKGGEHKLACKDGPVFDASEVVW